jgi:hypothetical protein
MVQEVATISIIVCKKRQEWYAGCKLFLFWDSIFEVVIFLCLDFAKDGMAT